MWYKMSLFLCVVLTTLIVMAWNGSKADYVPPGWSVCKDPATGQEIPRVTRMNAECDHLMPCEVTRICDSVVTFCPETGRSYAFRKVSLEDIAFVGECRPLMYRQCMECPGVILCAKVLAYQEVKPTGECSKPCRDWFYLASAANRCQF